MGVARTAVSAFVLRRTYSLACLLLHVAVSRSGYLGDRIQDGREAAWKRTLETYRGSNEGPKGRRAGVRIPAYIYRPHVCYFVDYCDASHDRQLLHRDCVTWRYIYGGSRSTCIVLLASMSCVFPFPPFFSSSFRKPFPFVS